MNLEAENDGYAGRGKLIRGEDNKELGTLLCCISYVIFVSNTYFVSRRDEKRGNSF